MSKVLNQGLFFLILTVSLRSISSAIFKIGALEINDYNFYSVLTNIFFITAFFLFFLRAIGWQLVLNKYELSFAYPFTGIHYIFLFLIGYFYFNEEMTLNKFLAILLILIGTTIIATSKNKAHE